MNILIFGPPGVGKGTQSALLKSKGFTHLSAGDILRKAAKKRSDIAEIIDGGNFVPDDLMVEMIQAKMKKTGKYLLDGFPRTLPQAVALAQGGEPIHLVIYLTADAETLCERIVARGLTSKRADDNAETFPKRLALYENLTAPVLDFYRQTGVEILEVDGMRSIEVIALEIEESINRLSQEIAAKTAEAETLA